MKTIIFLGVICTLSTAFADVSELNLDIARQHGGHHGGSAGGYGNKPGGYGNQGYGLGNPGGFQNQGSFGGHGGYGNQAGFGGALGGSGGHGGIGSRPHRPSSFNIGEQHGAQGFGTGNYGGGHRPQGGYGGGHRGKY